MTNEIKPHISIAAIGHFDAGKSTALGHLLFKTGYLSAEFMNRLEKETINSRKESFKYAWIFDELDVERERELTIYLKFKFFETEKFKITYIDTPGRNDFIKNMISGTSMADCALFIISAAEAEFECGSSYGRAFDYLLIARAVGVKQIIVGINKMDAINWSEDRFNQIRGETQKVLKKLGYNTETIPFIPFSGLLCDNMIEHSTKMSWFKGCEIIKNDTVINCRTLVDAINAIDVPLRLSEKPLRLNIHDVYETKDNHLIASGRVNSGKIYNRGLISIAPGPIGNCHKILSLRSHKNPIDEGGPGDFVELKLRKPDFPIDRGSVFSCSIVDPSYEVSSFIAKMVILGQAEKIRIGYTPVINCHTSTVACKITKVFGIIDIKTDLIIESDLKNMKNCDEILVEFVPTRPMCVETFNDYSSLGQFTVRDMCGIVAVGVIKEVFKNYRS